MATRAAKLLAFDQPLAGASVIITRPAAAAATIRRRVRALGGTPIGIPGSALDPVDDTVRARRELRAARTADVVVFVSPAAVRFAWSLLPGLRFARATPLLAPGVGSVRALRRRGVAGAAHPPLRQDSEGLLAMPQLAHVRRRCIAIIGAPGGRDVLARELRARGARLQQVEVYRRRAPRLDRRHFLRLERASGPLLSLFSSADALSHLHALLPAPLFAHLAAGECVVSSERLAEVARTLGFTRVHIAASPAPDAMLAAACAALARHRL